MTAIAVQLRSRPWLWSYMAAFVVWLVAIMVAHGNGAGEIVSAALSFGVFSVLVGMGQMFVMSSGAGNVDLSIPSTIALGGFVSTSVMGGHDGYVLAGLVAAVLVGVLVGIGNVLFIRFLRVPPIIATLSTSLMLQSITIAYGQGKLFAPPALFAWLMTMRVAGVPVSAVAAILLTLTMAVVLSRTLYGRALLATGQNERAARLAGIRVFGVRVRTYALSGAFAALCGAALAAFSGGPSLDMGSDYLFTSIALVVIGGSSVSGGRASLAGIWGAAMFVYLLVAMLNMLGVGAGWRLVFNGAVIVALIVVAGGDETV